MTQIYSYLVKNCRFLKIMITVKQINDSKIEKAKKTLQIACKDDVLIRVLNYCFRLRLQLFLIFEQNEPCVLIKKVHFWSVKNYSF